MNVTNSTTVSNKDNVKDARNRKIPVIIWFYAQYVKY